MARPRPGSRTLDCRFDHFVVAALDSGLDREVALNGIESYERADDIRKGIYRCARHRGVSAEAGPSRLADNPGDMGIHKDGKTYVLRFRLHDKKKARKHVLDKYGPDRSGWAYDPRRKATPEELAEWAPKNERGEPVLHKKEKK